MSLRFIIGRAGAGKTTYCLDEVRAVLRSEPCGAPMILLVPEQATFQVERALVNTPDLKGFMRVHVLSFKRLAGRLFQELGGGARREIGELGKLMVLRSLVLDRAGQLSVFTKGTRGYGLAERLAEALRELAMYKVTPQDLEARAVDIEQEARTATTLVLKMRDLALIAKAYREYLGNRFQDPDDHLTVAARKASCSSLTRGASVWVDGFRGFTPQEYSVLEALLPVADRVSVALCLDPESLDRSLDQTDLFYPTWDTYERLRDLARKLCVKVEDHVILSGDGLDAPTASAHGAGFTRLGTCARPCPVGEVGACVGAGPSAGSGIADSSARAQCASPRDRSACLRHLEREFGSRRPASFDGEPDGVRLVAAASPRVEVEAVAREILKLARERGMRFRDIGVIAPELETYHDLIHAVFKDHGIPFFIDRRKPVAHHPLVELIRSALDVVCEDWTYDAVFRYLKTDLVPVCRREVDLLENYVLARGIRGRRWLDTEPWEYRRASGLDVCRDSAEEAPLCREDQEMTNLINEAREKAVSALGVFYRELTREAGGAGSRNVGVAESGAAVAGGDRGAGRGKRVRDMARALFGLLTELNVRGQLERWAWNAALSGDMETAREHEQVWNAVIRMLDEAVEALGDRQTDAPAFRELIEAGLEGMTLGLIPPALDQVIVGSVERSRHPVLRAAFVIGATYEAFPRRVSEETVFSDHEREKLGEMGLRLAPTSSVAQFQERYNVYVALTRAREYLWVSYPMADGEGRAVRPSSVRAQLKAMFPGLAEGFVGDEVPSSQQEALDAVTSEARAVAMVVRHLRSSCGRCMSADVDRNADGHGEAGDFWLDLYEWLVEDPERRARASKVLGSLSCAKHMERLCESTARALYSNSIRTSVSRLETFARCPFSHFAGYVLRLAEREVFRLEPPGMGTFIHESLRMLIDSLGDERALVNMGNDEVKEKVGEVVNGLAPSLQNEILRSSGKYRYMERVLARILERAATVLQDHAKRSEFRSIKRELLFGYAGGGQDGVPGLEIEIEDGRRISLSGKIDRVDLAEAGDRSFVRVIDYKSSQRRLDLADAYHGLALQLLVYLAIVEEQSVHIAGKPAEPAGALYFPTLDPVVSSPGPLDDESLERMRKRRLRLAGLIVGGAEVVKLMDREIKGVSDIVPAMLTKDGAVARSSRGSVIERDKYDMLRRFLLARIKELSSRITAGEIAPRPFRRGKARACQWCGFKPVCGFDILLPGNEYRTITRMKDDDFWAAIENETSGGTAL